MNMRANQRIRTLLLHLVLLFASSGVVTLVLGFSPFGVVPLRHRLGKTFVGPLSRLYSTPRDESTDEDDEEEEDEQPYNLFGYANSVGSSSSSSNKVRPIGVDGQYIPEPTKDPSRIRAKFDDLFSGMPSVTDILGGSTSEGVDETTDDSSSSDVPSSSRRPPANRDVESEPWFAEERQRILDNYEAILANMLDDLELQRAEDPESVPDNAVAMIKSVLKEEMDREIAETLNRQSRERLQSYEDELRRDTETKDLTGARDATVDRLMQESEDEYAQWEASRAEVDEFMRYEEEAYQRAVEGSNTIPVPESSADLDQWALQSLQAMADSRRQTEGGEVVLDNLDDNVSDLRDQIDKEAKKGNIRPETLKEWQMYRSIATKLEEGGEQGTADESEAFIMKQLDSWKDYVQKETKVRDSSGLSRGPKLPFEWQESELTTKQGAVDQPEDKRTRSQVRKDINRMSIEALESLLETSDAARREAIQKEVDFLKATLESRDYLDIEVVDEDDEEEAAGPLGPVDLTDVFSSDLDSELTESRATTPPSYPEEDVADEPPSTPFFSGDFERTAPEPVSEAKPNTPFFSDGDDEISADEVAAVDSKLGGMEEQKLKAMFRRAGVQSVEEQEKIRQQWEEFQRIEEEKRIESGLSAAGTAESSKAAAELKYNISDVIREDGDVDAEKVLASIGPRPVRMKKTAPSTQPGGVTSAESAVVSDDEGALASSVDEDEVKDSLFRAVSAVGGGRYRDDPEAKARDQASYEEFLQKQEENRRSLDQLGVEGESLGPPLDDSFDDVEYAEEVISSLGPRPKPRRSRIVDEGEYSDQGGILASEEDDGDDEDDDGDGDLDADEDGEGDGSSGVAENESVWDSMPDWLRKEKEQGSSVDGRSQGRFLGSEMDDMFDDDGYDKNMRQLHEYEQRRAGKQQRQMGIDISDVLGRRSFERDDYADYKYDDESFRTRQGSGWGSASFDARKRDLMDYTELDMRELNSLMDHKESVYSTGYSKYTPRINKPFKAFGAIFRLEGVLVDTTGLQLRAWTKVAADLGYKAPSLDDVRRASVVRPEIAVREILFWTDDFLEIKKVAEAHRLAFRGEFDAWAREAGVQSASSLETEGDRGDGGFLAMGQEVVEGDESAAAVVRSRSAGTGKPQAPVSPTNAWAAVAEMYGLPMPSQDKLFQAASVSPEETVTSLFGWSKDPTKVQQLVKSYTEQMLFGNLRESLESPPPVPAASPSASGGVAVLDESAVMEVHYHAWSSVAERFGFPSPDPEEVMAAFVINDPEIAARDGFGWTDDDQKLAEVVSGFRSTLAKLLEERTGGGSGERLVEQIGMPSSLPSSSAVAASSEPDLDAAGAKEKDLVGAHDQAWTSVAQKYGFGAPTLDLVQLAMKVEPREAVTRLLRWTEEADAVSEVVSSFESALKEACRERGISEDLLPRVLSAVASKSATGAARGPSADEIFRVAVDAWTAVAKKRGFPVPDAEQVQFALSVGPEEAVRTGFEWASLAEEVESILSSYQEEIGLRRQQWSGAANSDASASGGGSGPDGSGEAIPAVVVSPDAARWVRSLLEVEMQCAVVSFLEREQVDLLLEFAGLSELFPFDRRVSSTNGYGSDSQQLMGAALRVERRPDHCAVFDSSPYASLAAHEVDIKSVNMIGMFPRYELLASDLTANSFFDLTAMNIRRLFGTRMYDQTQQETQKESTKSVQVDVLLDDV